MTTTTNLHDRKLNCCPKCTKKLKQKNEFLPLAEILTITIKTTTTTTTYTLKKIKIKYGETKKIYKC